MHTRMLDDQRKTNRLPTNESERKKQMNIGFLKQKRREIVVVSDKTKMTRVETSIHNSNEEEKKRTTRVTKRM